MKIVKTFKAKDIDKGIILGFLGVSFVLSFISRVLLKVDPIMADITVFSSLVFALSFISYTVYNIIYFKKS